MGDNIVWLIGNGFNKSVENTLENTELKLSIKNHIKLWDKFERIFGDIRKSLSNDKNISDEEVIEQIFKLFDIFSSLGNPMSSNNYAERINYCINLLKENINKTVASKIFEVILDFMKAETDGVYGELNRSGINSDLGKLLNKNTNFFFTTNYDGIGEMVFGIDSDDKRISKDHRIADFFNNCPMSQDSYLCYYMRHNLKDARGCYLHLHGSYRYFLKQGTGPIKLKKEFIEKIVQDNKLLNGFTPIIIFNAPNTKLHFIEANSLLSNYFNLFKEALYKNHKLVIWGQSLKSDPHILKLITDNYDRLEKILILDPQGEKIKERISIKLQQPDLEKFHIINPKEQSISKLVEQVLDEMSK